MLAPYTHLYMCSVVENFGLVVTFLVVSMAWTESFKIPIFSQSIFSIFSQHNSYRWISWSSKAEHDEYKFVKNVKLSIIK